MPLQFDIERPIRVGFLLLSDFSLVAFTGALDVLVTANLVAGKTVYDHKTFGLDDDTVKSDLGLNIAASGTVESLNHPKRGDLDLFIICGGFRSKLDQNSKLTSLIKELDKNGIQLGGIWNGAVALAHAGVLDGKECAIHPDNHAYMHEKFPKVTISKNTLVHDQDRITCAGPSSAIEMMFNLLKKLPSNDLVRAVREILSCDQVAESRDAIPLQMGDDPTYPESLRTIMELMRKNIDEPLTLAELAELSDISRRQMERLFQTHVNSTPSRYYLELRLNYARRLLTQTNESITNVALASGFVSTSHFSNCYKDTFGISPTATRVKKGAHSHPSK
jgi:transcriptional regulator GlxA family with amidase domain